MVSIPITADKPGREVVIETKYDGERPLIRQGRLVSPRWSGRSVDLSAFAAALVAKADVKESELTDP
jgi:hypothetical protein